MGFKKMILGEKVPDKDDPRYKELHEKSFNAGASFAKNTRLDKLASNIQKFAQQYPKLFLGIIFSIVLFCVGLNLYRIATAVKRPIIPSSAIQLQEQQLRMHRHPNPQNRADSVQRIAYPKSITK